jgi:hypothetical protein
MDSDLVRDYLADLESASTHLAADARVELLGDVRAHIGLALEEAGRTDETTIRDVLDRLGSPSEIVAGEPGEDTVTLEGPLLPAQLIPVRWRPLSVETRALLLLTVGAVVLPFIGPAIGLWFASSSKRWTLTQKRTVALILFVLLAMPFALLVPAALAGEITWVFTSGGFLLPFVPLAGWLAASYLVVSSSLVVTVSRRP